jgi:hypothetical protein
MKTTEIFFHHTLFGSRCALLFCVLLTACGGGNSGNGNSATSSRINSVGNSSNNLSSNTVSSNAVSSNKSATTSVINLSASSQKNSVNSSIKSNSSVLNNSSKQNSSLSSSASSFVTGVAGCGLSSAAFCETFDAPSNIIGRSRELDSTRWSAGRLAPQTPSANGVAIGIGPATIPSCRNGLPAKVGTDQDTLICDANTNIQSKHLMVVTAAQNYGQNSYRIRQPFDFSGRTGKIVFDAEAFMLNSLIGWISVEVVEDPINAPSFAVGGPTVNNDEGSLIPRNGFEIQFQNTCDGYVSTPHTSLRMLQLYKNYQGTTLQQNGTPVCMPTLQEHLNRFEIRVAQNRIEIYATPYSVNGSDFAAPVLMYGANVDLPFTRGYVSITTHNHASLKYSANNDLEAWVARWDNVGFDGPIINNWREYEVPDSLIAGTDAQNRPGPVVSIGYRIADAANGPSQTLQLKNVDLNQVTSARLSLSPWYLTSTSFGANVSQFILRYRFNGKAWRDRAVTAEEINLLTSGQNQGQIGQMMDVPLADLIQGDNTLEFVTVNVPQNYPPVIANIDLVLSTE